MSNKLYSSFRDVQITNFEKVLKNDFKSIFFLPDFSLSSVSYLPYIIKNFESLSFQEKVDLTQDLLMCNNTESLSFIFNHFPEVLYAHIDINENNTLIAFHALRNNELINLIIHKFDILKTDDNGFNILYYIGGSLYHQDIFKNLFDKVSLLSSHHIQYFFNQPSKGYPSPIIKSIEDNNSYLLLFAFLFISPIEKTQYIPYYFSSPYIYLKQCRNTLDEHMMELYDFSEKVYIQYQNVLKIFKK